MEGGPLPPPNWRFGPTGPDSTGFYRVLPGFTGFYRVLPGFCCVLIYFFSGFGSFSVVEWSPKWVSAWANSTQARRRPGNDRSVR